MQYTEKELKELIKAVETEFTSHLAKAEVSAQPAPLAKAEDESKEAKPSEDKKESEAPAKEESKEEKAPEAEGKEEAPAAEAKEDAAPAKEEAPAAEAKEAAPAPAADEASGYDAEDIAQMDAMYMSMSKAELLAHHDSCVRALDAIGAEHTHAAPAAPAAEAQAPAAPAAPAAEIDKCGDMSMAKSEANPELELAKSEVEAQKAKNAELQKSLDTVSEFLTKLVKKVPQGKAITSMEQIAKSETGASEEKQLSKSEITAILSKKAADPTLSKSDREAINAFYLNQSNINTISHLLK